MADDSLAKVLAGLGLGAGGFLAATVLNKVAEKSGESLVGLVRKATTAVLLGLVRVFRGDRMLERYRRAIPAQYGSHVLTQKRTIGIRELYVDLQYVKAGSRHDLLSYVSGQRAVLVLGEAGAGKSLLLKSFLLRWAADPGRQGKIPVLVELHRCNAENPDFVQLIADRFTRSGDHGGAKAREFVQDRLAKGDLRILFDGLDELSTERQDAVAAALRSFREQYAATDEENAMVVTCRGSAYLGQLGDPFTKVEIAEFDDAAVLRFLGKWLTSEKSPDSGRTDEEIASFGTAEQIFEQIRQNPLLINLAHNPLLLSLIADLYTVKVAGKGGTLPAFRSELYGEITGHLISRDPLMGRQGYQSPFDSDEKLAVLKRVALVMTETSPAEGDRLVIASTQLDEAIKDALTDRNLTFESGRGLLREIVERSGLLVRSENGERYWFAHRSFQEYLTARALEQRRHIGRLLDGYWSDPVFWRDTVRFWCGLRDVDCTDVVADIFRTDDEDEPEPSVLALECLTDAREIDGALAQEIITYFMDRLADTHDVTRREAMIDAFGAVAAGSGLRSEDVYRRLRTRAERGEPPAMEALVMSGRESAAKLLVRRAAHGDTYARICLREMGEAAVPALATVAGDGTLWAIDILGEIGTPAAAVELTGFVWQGPESEAAHRAAWWLAALFAHPSVEQALRERPCPHGDGFPVHEYAWVPFHTGHETDSVLGELAGRVSYLLDPRERPEKDQDPDLDERPPPLGRIDPRIGIQLAALNIAHEWRAPTEPTQVRENSALLQIWSAALAPSRDRAPALMPMRHKGGQEWTADPKTGSMVDRIFELNGLSARTQRLVGMLPLRLRAEVVRQTIWPSHLNRESARKADIDAWCRATRDTEHQTGPYDRAAEIGMVLCAAAVGLGAVRALAILFGGWLGGPHVPRGLVGAAAVPGALAVLSALGWALLWGRESEERDTLGAAVLVLMVPMLLISIVLAPMTVAAWIGWIATGALFAGLIALVAVPLVLVSRIKAQNENPFRRILAVYRESLDADQRS